MVPFPCRCPIPVQVLVTRTNIMQLCLPTLCNYNFLCPCTAAALTVKRDSLPVPVLVREPSIPVGLEEIDVLDLLPAGKCDSCHFSDNIRYHLFSPPPSPPPPPPPPPPSPSLPPTGRGHSPQRDQQGRGASSARLSGEWGSDDETQGTSPKCVAS